MSDILGLLGGTFDPIHYGHLRPALEIQQTLGLKQIHFIPLGTAVHRAPPVASARQRLQMVQAAVLEQPEFITDAREVNRTTPSYTIDTLIQLHEERPNAKLCMLLGADAFANFLTWHKYLDILQLAHLIVMQRPNTIAIPKTPKDPALSMLLAERYYQNFQNLGQALPGRIILQPVTQLAISSSAIRNALAFGNSVRFLLPDPVIQIIYNQSIYL